MVPFLKHKLLKQHKTDQQQYPTAPTSTANRSTLKPLFSITLFSGKYLWTLALWQVSMYCSHGHVSSMRITLFSLLEKIVMSGLSSVNAMWSGKEKFISRSPNKTQSDPWCNVPPGEKFLFFTLVLFLKKFIFMGCFEVGTEDLIKSPITAAVFWFNFSELVSSASVADFLAWSRSFWLYLSLIILQ